MFRFWKGRSKVFGELGISYQVPAVLFILAEFDFGVGVTIFGVERYSFGVRDV